MAKNSQNSNLRQLATRQQSCQSSGHQEEEMPYPPYHRVRARYPFLEREAYEFYWSLPSYQTISVAESYRVLQADLPLMLWSVPRILNLFPEISRISGPIKVQKEVIYLLNNRQEVIDRSAWNRDPNQRLVSIFKNLDASLVETIHIQARRYGIRRSKRQNSLVQMYALQGIILHPPREGFHKLVARALAP